jgi:hypothetical protein
MTKDQMLAKIREKLKDQEFELIEWSCTEDCILLRKILCAGTKIDNVPVPTRYNRIVNVYKLMYELEILKF